MADGRFEALYAQVASGEKEVGALVVQFEQAYPGIVRMSNVNEVAESLQKKTDRASILAKLREKKAEAEQAAEKKPRRKRDDHER